MLPRVLDLHFHDMDLDGFPEYYRVDVTDSPLPSGRKIPVGQSEALEIMGTLTNMAIEHAGRIGKPRRDIR